MIRDRSKISRSIKNETEIEHLQRKIKLNCQAVLPHKNALQQSLKDYTYACETIQKFWRNLKLKKIKNKAKILKCKIRCLCFFVLILKKVQKNRNLLYEDLQCQWYKTVAPKPSLEQRLNL
jgi:hypothetical protein